MEHEIREIYQGIILCPMTHKDIHKYRILRNQNREYFFNTDVISSEQQEAWYKVYLKSVGEYMFSIYDVKNNYMGGCGLYNINEHYAEFGRIIIDSQMRGGSGVKATVAALEVAKRILLLDTVAVYVKENNIAALRCYDKAGFNIVDNRNGIIQMLRQL